MGLNLELTKASSLEGALKHFTEPEILERENAYKCPKCKKPVQARKQFTIHRAPAILVIQLKRFTWTGSKISKKVTYPSELDLSPYLTENNVITQEQVREAMKLKEKLPREKHAQMLKRSLSASNLDGAKRSASPDSQYELYGVLVHLGGGCHSGHYICYVKAANKVWHRMDDSHVQKVSQNEVMAQTDAYMLFYRRKPGQAEAQVDSSPESVTPSSPVTPSIAPKTIETPAVSEKPTQQKAQKLQQQQQQEQQKLQQKQKQEQQQKPQKLQDQQQKPKQAASAGAPPAKQEIPKKKVSLPVAMDDGSDESESSDPGSSSSSIDSSIEKEKKRMLAVAEKAQRTNEAQMRKVQVLTSVSDDEKDGKNEEIVSKVSVAKGGPKHSSKKPPTKSSAIPIRSEEFNKVSATAHLLVTGKASPQADKDEVDLEKILGQMEKKHAKKEQPDTQQPQKKRKREEDPAATAASPAKKAKKAEQPQVKPSTSAQDLNKILLANNTFATLGSKPSLFGSSRVTSWASEGASNTNGASYESSLRTQLLAAEESISTTGIKKRMRDEYDVDYDRGNTPKRRKKESDEEESKRKPASAMFQKVSDKNVKKRNDEIARERKSFSKFNPAKKWQKRHKHAIKERKRTKSL